MNHNVVAVIGRPNVGKSTLVNRILGHRSSIVAKNSGTTRDRLYYQAKWKQYSFTMIDTGGIVIDKQSLQNKIKLQVEIAIEEAQIILFVVDGRSAITDDEQLIISILRKFNKRTYLLANKMEDKIIVEPSIYKLGLTILPISALHGQGIKTLLDQITKHFKLFPLEKNNSTKLAIIGKTNVGKSSLLNALTQTKRAIVSPIDGTTKDAVDAMITINQQKFRLIDTAGLKQKSKLIASIDHYALERTRNTIINSDIALLLVDATNDISHFDLRIAGYALETHKAIILIVNKLDLLDKSSKSMKSLKQEIETKFKFINWAPIIFISATKLLNLDILKQKILVVKQNLTKQIPTHLLNDLIRKIQIANPAPLYNKARLNILFGKQMLETKSPTFIFLVNNKKYLHFSYERFLENQLRNYFDFMGVSIKLDFKTRKKTHQ